MYYSIVNCIGDESGSCCHKWGPVSIVDRKNKSQHSHHMTFHCTLAEVRNLMNNAIVFCLDAVD